MNPHRLIFPLLLAAFAVIGASATAEAQLIRYVSFAGDDTKNCASIANACRTIQRAINLATANTEIRILTSGGFAGATIAKSLTITGDGASVHLGGPLTISNADAVVTIRGLLLNGHGAVTSGIRINAATAVHIEDSTLEHFTGNGIQQDSASELFVADSISRDNGGNGLFVGTGSPKVMIDNSRFENNANDGMLVIAAKSTITRSVTSGNGLHGIEQAGGTMSVAWTTAASNDNGSGFAVGTVGGQMSLESCVARGNFIGVFVGSGATIRISTSVATNNGTGIFNSSGTVLTRQNNTISGNTQDVNGTLTPLGAL